MKRAAAFLAVLAAALAMPAAALEPLPAVLHVHSDLSTGDFSLEQLAGIARAAARTARNAAARFI